jgi:hypothetical protein
MSRPEESQVLSTALNADSDCDSDPDTGSDNFWFLTPDLKSDSGSLVFHNFCQDFIQIVGVCVAD